MRRLLIVVGLVGWFSFVSPPAEAGGGCHGAGEPSGSGTTVELRMNCMNPRVLHAAGDSAEITFVNRDGVVHNVYGDRWGIDELATGESATQRFGPGVNVYSCTLHPGMVGAVIVGDGVAASVAGATPVRAVSAAGTDESSSGGAWVLAAVVGVAVGAAGTVGLRRIRTR